MTGTPTAARTPRLAGEVPGRARGVGVVVDPRRPAGLEHQRAHVPAAGARPGADGVGPAPLLLHVATT